MGEKYGHKNLTRVKHAFEKIRICNSDDYYESDDGGFDDENVIRNRTNGNRNGSTSSSEEPEQKTRCRIPVWNEYFDMGETRLANGDGAPNVILTWMYQILLTEILEVPATIEQGINITKGTGSFYHKMSDFQYAVDDNEESNAQKLLKAAEVGDCRKTDEPCAHFVFHISDSDGTDLYGK